MQVQKIQPEIQSDPSLNEAKRESTPHAVPEIVSEIFELLVLFKYELSDYQVARIQDLMDQASHKPATEFLHTLQTTVTETVRTESQGLLIDFLKNGLGSSSHLSEAIRNMREWHSKHFS
jgi:hypothetical protein